MSLGMDGGAVVVCTDGTCCNGLRHDGGKVRVSIFDERKKSD